MNRNTEGPVMPKTKIAITIESSILEELDGLVADNRFSNRSQAIEMAVVEKLERLNRTRLLAELNKLDPQEEKRIAEEGMTSELAGWPEY